MAGQCWLYRDLDIETVLVRLDQIEVTNQPGVPNEYDRVRVPVHSRDFLLDDAHPLPRTYHLQAAAAFEVPGFPIVHAWTYRFHREPTDEGFRQIRGTAVTRRSGLGEATHEKVDVVWWMK